eukprot:1061386-Amphidinium_carterae.1
MEVKPCRDPEGQPVLAPASITSVVAHKECAGGPRGDECLGYLAHLVDSMAWQAGMLLVTLQHCVFQADPQDHLHFSYLHIVFKMIERTGRQSIT